MADRMLSVECSMYVDTRIRAPWVLVSRNRNANRGVVVVSHHESWQDAEDARREYLHECAQDQSVANHERWA